MIRQKPALALAGAASALLVMASTAFACTTVAGSTNNLSPTSGTRNTNVTISANGSGAASGVTFGLWYLNPSSAHDTMNTCMGTSSQQIQVGTTTKVADGQGNIATISGTINVGAAGTAWVCFLDSGLLNATNPASFTVT